MTDYSAFYNSDAAGMVQRAQPAPSQPAPAPTSFESLDLNERRQAAPHMGGPSAGYQYRIACDRVACGEWEGRVELGIIDGNCMQLVFEDEPPLGIGLETVSAVQLSVFGADAESAETEEPGTPRTPRDDLAGLSDMARQQAARAPRPPPDGAASSLDAAGADALSLGVRLDLELEVPLEPEGLRSGRLLRAYAPLEEAPAMGKLVQSVHAARSGNPAAPPLAFGVPPWAPKCPPALYGGELRRFAELAVVIWTVGTVFWAIWQLYHNSEVVHAALEPFVLFVYYYFDQWLERINAWLHWLTLLFYAWFRPLVIVLTHFASSLAPLLRPLWGVMGAVLPPLVRVLSPLMRHLSRFASVLQRMPCSARLLTLFGQVRRPRQLRSASAPCRLTRACLAGSWAGCCTYRCGCSTSCAWTS